MAVQQPNQYQCNQMEKGDIIFVKHRSFIYKLIRELLYSNKPKLTVRKDWNEPPSYVTYYQEDCVLMYSYELQCIQSIKNDIIGVLGYGKQNKIVSSFKIKRVDVSLYNIQLVFKSGFVLTIPLDKITNAMKQNELNLKLIEDNRKIQTNLKYIRYKGSYFKNYVEQNNIKHWKAQYCTVCGKPITFRFKKDEILINNGCTCGNLSLNIQKMTYDEFAIWYASQVNSVIEKHYREFWFKEGN